VPALKINAERLQDEGAASNQRLVRLVREHMSFVWRLLRRLGVADADADDAAQQAFITLSNRLSDVLAGRERAFLVTTALHIGLRMRRDRARRRETLGVELDERPDPAPSADELIDAQRARTLLDSLVAEMPEDLQLVFVLFEIEQLSSGEIAEVVGVPLGTVASRLRRARADFVARVARLEAHRKFGGRSDG